MGQKFIYIGGDAGQIERFRALTGDDNMSIAGSPDSAIKMIRQSGGEIDMAALVEKRDTKSDLQTIKTLRRNFPALYIILISCPLDREASIAYLKAGVNNTITASITEQGCQDLASFLNAHRDSVTPISRASRRELHRSKLPLWKRSFDVAASLFAIILLSPLMLAMVLAIKIEDPGPAIYRSKRVGSNYRIFDFLKFRSMYTDADRRLKEFEALNQYAGQSELEVKEMNSDVLPGMISDDVLISDDFMVDTEAFAKTQRQKQEESFVKFANDPRITKVGRFIRKYSIDELPQLFNILKGDMSVVGNRPLPLYEAEKLTGDEYIDRFMAPAGLTGLWQVEKRGDAGKMSAEERKQLDNVYAKNYSFGMDMKIIFKTFTAFIQKENV